VAEILHIPADGPAISGRFHPDIAATIVAAPDGVDAGWSYDGDAFAAPAPSVPAPAPVPASITRRQLLLALTAAGLMTGEEALAAAMTGAVPASIDAVFAALPAADALAARITWATMAIAERDHPLIAALVAADLATEAALDALFVAAAAL
jgi:hypothetical protein